MKNHLTKRLLAHINNPSYEPLTKSEIARTLNIHPKERASLRAVIRELESNGKMIRTQKGRYAPGASAGSRSRQGSSKKGSDIRPSNNLLVGTLQIDRAQGAHFTADPKAEENRNVRIPGPSDKRIPVSPRDTLTAQDGDRVLVHIETIQNPKWWKKSSSRKGPQRGRERARSNDTRVAARVVRVLDRSRPIVGTYFQRGKFNYVKPDNQLLPPTIELSRDTPLPKKLEDGFKVVVEIAQWEHRDQPPHGTITNVLGNAEDPGVDILSIIHEKGLRDEFPEKVLNEARSIPREIPPEEIAKREDWRDKFIFTIDPVDARDFDDAIGIKELPDGGWELAVHIADVSHYVRPGTALDEEAIKRGNSTYLADRVLPMLPEELSNVICSLQPDVDRLTRGAVLTYDKNGKEKKARFFSGIIRSAKRLTYEQAFERLEDPKADLSDPVNAALKMTWALASKLRANRFANGSLELEMPEVRAVLDENGTPIRLHKSEYDAAHQLIEECMLAANEAAARTLTKKQIPAVYRVHDDPDPEKLETFGELASLYGHHLRNPDSPQEINALIAKIKGRPEDHAIKIALLKSMKRAAYSTDPQGHYGLSKANYTHFTSPIRRYADLIVHRALYPEEGTPKPDSRELRQIANHISTTERTSAEAEIETQRLKQLEFFKITLDKDPNATFSGTVTDARRMGIFVELDDLMVRGLVRTNLMPGEDWWFDPGRMAFSSRHPKRTVAVGDKVKIVVDRVDLVKKFLDFRLL